MPLNIFPPDFVQPNISIHESVSIAMKSLWVPPSTLSTQLHEIIDAHVSDTQSVVDARDQFNLTYGETCAIVYYTADARKFGGTLEQCVFRAVNLILVSRQIGDDWRPFLWFLIRGLEKLPDVQKQVFRGIDQPLTKLSKQYKPNNKVVWVAFTSASQNKEMMNQFSQSVKNQGTWMALNVTRGKDISEISLFKNETEVLLLPNTTFLVKDVLSDDMKAVVNVSTDMTVMHLAEISREDFFGWEQKKLSPEFILWKERLKNKELVLLLIDFKKN